MYHVVVCSNCKNVWIVQNRPNTSQCGKCRRTRKFKLLKKYHKTDDKEEAKLARAFYQSRVDGQEELFDRALDKGALEEDLDAFLDEDTHLEMRGMDPQQVRNAVENILSNHNRRSEIRIIRDAFRDLDNPNLSEFLDYTREYGISDENALIKLEGLVRSGSISEFENIQLSEIDGRVEELFETAHDTEIQPVQDGPIDNVSSHQGIIFTAVNKHRDGSLESILEFIEDRGMGRSEAIIRIEKLAISGTIETNIDLQTISDRRAEIVENEELDFNDEYNIQQLALDTPHESPDKQEARKGFTRREIIEKAIEEQEEPTVESVIDHARSHGIGSEKAQRILEKLRQKGDVVETPDRSLRII